MVRLTKKTFLFVLGGVLTPVVIILGTAELTAGQLRDIPRVKAQGRITRLNRLTHSLSYLANHSAAFENDESQRLQEPMMLLNLLQNKFPRMGEAYGFKGYCLFYQQDLTRSLQHFQKAESLNPGIFWWPYNQGVIHFLQGDKDAGRECVGRAAALKPQATLAMMQQSPLYQKLFLYLSNDYRPVPALREGYEEAQRYLQILNQINPPNEMENPLPYEMVLRIF